MKKLCIILVFTMIFNLILGVCAYADTPQTVTTDVESQEVSTNEESREIGITQETDLNLIAKSLNNLGILTGTEKGFELERGLTRVEGSTIVVRLGVSRSGDLPEDITYPFTDVPLWASENVNYLYQIGAVNGVSETLFGSNNSMTAQQFTTMVLRLLEYNDKEGDFVWNKALDKALEIGLIDKSNKERIEKSGTFTRGDMALIAYNALFQTFKNSDKRLLELQSNTQTANGLTGLFTVDLTDEEVAELMRPDRTPLIEDLFNNNTIKTKEIEEKIIYSMKGSLDFYSVYYNSERYDLNISNLKYIGKPDDRNRISFSVECMAHGNEKQSKVLMTLSYKLEGNKLIPWSDEDWRAGIAEAVIMYISLNKGGYIYDENKTGGWSEYNKDSLDKIIGIYHNDKKLESYLVPFDNGNYKIIIQDYK